MAPPPPPPEPGDGGPRVELWAAPLPRPLSPLAWHGWFVVREGERATRWEVWQRRDAGGVSAGHVHRDLMRPEGAVGGGPAQRLVSFDADDSARLAAVLKGALETYPHRYLYRYWPGPNSNTFIRWVLDEAGLWGGALLDPRLVGKDYLGRFGVGVRRASGLVQLASPLVSVRFGGQSRLLEVSALGLTVLGLAQSPPTLLTPFGPIRLGTGEKERKS